MSKKQESAELPVIIVGLGAVARTAADVLVAEGRALAGYLDTAEQNSRRPQEINDVPVLGTLTEPTYQKLLKEGKVDYFVAEPDTKLLPKVYAGLFALTGRLPLTLIHPSVIISPSADLAAGNLLEAGCVIGAGVKAETQNRIGLGVLIDIDVVLGSYCILSMGACIGAGAKLGDNVYIGPGAVIQPNVVIENGALVGAGAVVLKAVKAGDTVFGVPATVVK